MKRVVRRHVISQTYSYTYRYEGGPGSNPTTKSILIRARASLRGPRAACAVSVTVLTVKLP